MATDSITWMRRFICGLHGHDSLLQFERGRLSLKCTSCGHETPGWDLKKRGESTTEPAVAADEPMPQRRWLPQFANARRMVIGH